MNGDVLNALLAFAGGALVVLTILVLLVAICLPGEKRSAILRHLWRRWII